MALHSFNLATMSGVFPGSRTQIYQRVQVLNTASMATAAWIQLLWHNSPRRCTVHLAAPGSNALAVAPLVEFAAPEPALFWDELSSALDNNGWQPVCCGSCHFWQADDSTVSAPAEIPLGRCGWQNQAGGSPATLQRQSALALRCPQWQPRREPATPIALTPSNPVARTLRPAAAGPLRRSGETAAIRFWWWQRLQRTVRSYLARLMRRQTVTDQSLDWETLLEERSGVGAGTEPCFVCQGRIANLGALTVATPEDDKQTFSVWRCRSCHTLYLNDWIDRWERLDSLETEESYYRIAPAEAVHLLQLIYQERGSEHPSRRHERSVQRQHFLDFMAGRHPVSHQVRQGR